MQLFVKSSIVGIAVALGSCSSDNDNSNSNNETSLLEGTWELACYEDTELPPELEDLFRKTEVTFAGGSTGTFTSTYTGHNSADCSTSAIADESGSLTGTYLIGNESTSSDGLPVTEIDIMAETVTPLGESTISPFVDQPLTLDIFNIDDATLYFGIIDDPNAEPPIRATSIDFDRPFVKQ